MCRIERVSSRGPVPETPALDAEGHYVLGDPVHGPRKHHACNAVKVATVEEAVALIRRGFSLRMGAPGLRASLVSPAQLRIVAHD